MTTTLLSDADRERVNKAVAAAEAKASVEIIPALARHSGRYDRAEDIVGLWTGVLFMVVVWLLLPAPPPPGSWGGIPSGWQLVILLAALLGGFFLGAAIAGHVDWLRALFTPDVQKQEEVFARARQVFFDSRVHHSSRGNGLLIYVSMLERTACVLADQTILEKLGQAAIDELCGQLTNQLRTQSPADALCATIAQAGERLSAVLPRGEGQANELPDAVIVLS